MVLYQTLHFASTFMLLCVVTDILNVKFKAYCPNPETSCLANNLHWQIRQV